MRVLAAVHQGDAGPGVFAEAVRGRGDELVEWRPAERGAPPAAADALLVFGGAMHTHQEDRHPWLRAEKRGLAELVAQGVPALGVCLGAELLAELAGWRVVELSRPEIGWHDVELTQEGSSDPLLSVLPARFGSFQWHSYASEPPPGAPLLARNASGAQAYRLGERVWGIQFHAEVTAAIVDEWLATGSKDTDAIKAGIDPAAVGERTRREIRGWNELGRDLCERFLELAEAA